MAAIRALMRRVWGTFRRNSRDRELEQELRVHLELARDEMRRRGGSPEDAERAARVQAGGIEQAMEALRDQRGLPWLDDLARDVRHALRTLRRSPGFTAVALITLALGIGGNAAIFGVLKSVLINSLPYGDAGRLVRVYARRLDGLQERAGMSAGQVNDIAERQRSFQSIAAFAGGVGDAVYGSDDGPRTVKAMWVEAPFFETLGIRPARGRTFHAEDATNALSALSGGILAPDTAHAVIVSHSAWQRLFANDEAILGHEVRIDGIARTVIGVLPSNFAGPEGDADFYLAMDLGPVRVDPNAGRRSYWLGLVGRLKPGVEPETAQSDLTRIGTDLARDYPASDAALGLVSLPIHTAMAGDTRRPLLLLMASAGLVLLIACANLAAALLSRSLSRRKEFAIRVAIGAGRWRLVRQLLTESLLLSIGGGAAGILLAQFLLGALHGSSLKLLPDYAGLSLDVGAVIVTGIIAVGTGIAFGIAPAISIARSDPESILRDSGRGVSESRRSRGFRGVLVAGQIALSVSLLAGAGLLGRSLWAMMSTPLGFDPNGVLTSGIQLPPRGYATPEARARFLDQLAERLRSIPGVASAATSTSVPTVVLSHSGFAIVGAPFPPGLDPFVLFARVSDDYFQTLRIPLSRGRTFDARDRADAPQTAVISESMARRYWPSGDALGAQIRLGPNPNAPAAEIIGIVGDVHNDPARADAEPMAYRPSRQSPVPFVRVLVRTAGDPLALVKPVERELAALDTGIPLDRPMTLNAILDEGLAGRRFPVALITAFAALALLLASVGVYAMFANMAAAREGEFAIRLALGSRPLAIAALVLQQGAFWMAAGLAGGVFGIITVMRLLRDLLYGVSPFDPVALGLAVTILLASAAMALSIPLRRAARVAPANALRL